VHSRLLVRHLLEQATHRLEFRSLELSMSIRGYEFNAHGKTVWLELDTLIPFGDVHRNGSS
jgi:hypothetical protein